MKEAHRILTTKEDSLIINIICWFYILSFTIYIQFVFGLPKDMICVNTFSDNQLIYNHPFITPHTTRKNKPITVFASYYDGKNLKYNIYMYSMIYVPLIKGVYYRLTTSRELSPN